MKLKDLIGASGYLAILGGDAEITNITIDSRHVRPGDLYICITGTKLDGHAFALDAEAKGAAALAVEQYVEGVTIPQVLYADSRLAFSRLAAAWYDFPAKELNIIGVTGTNGKTTTTTLLKSILECAGHKVGLMGTIGTMIGEETLAQSLTTPDPMDLHHILRRMKSAGCDWVVMEVSAHALALRKLDGLFFRVAVFTNLTQDHLNDFHTMENYQNAKKKLFDDKLAATAVMNADDPACEDLLENFHGDTLLYSLEGRGDITAQGLKLRPDGLAFTMDTPQGEAQIDMHLPGHFNASNAMAAAGAALFAGASLEDIAQGLSALENMNGRMDRVDTGLDFTTLVDYAHSPDSLENLLKAARRLTDGHVILVFGCGGDRDMSKRAVMGEIASRLSDYFVITSDNPRTEPPMEIISMIEAGVVPGAAYIALEDRDTAIGAAMAQAGAGDMVLIAGKGHETYQEIMGVKRHFDDKEAVLRHAEGLKGSL